MTDAARSAGKKRRRSRLRLFTYGLLALWLVDYFLIQPERLKADKLPPPADSLKPLVTKLQQHTQFLASEKLKGRAPGTLENAEAAEYILNAFRDMKLASPAPDGTMLQELSDGLGHNVFAALPGFNPERDWLLLGAHFDHLGEWEGKTYLGADDNASAVAILLETARRLKAAPAFKRYNILFVAFNSEESPYFLTAKMGSFQFYNRIEKTGIDPERIRLAVIMDLMGGVFWRPLKDTLFVLGAEKTPALRPLIDSVHVPDLDTRRLGMSMIENVPRAGSLAFSDYQVFRIHAIPYLFLSSGRTPHYHRTSDTMEKLNHNRMAKTVHWLEHLFNALDGFEGPWTYRWRGEDYETDYKSIAPLIETASRWTTKVPQTGWISLARLKQDHKRLQKIGAKLKAGTAPDAADGAAMQLASIRLQCLLGKMGPCFLLPGTKDN